MTQTFSCGDGEALVSYLYDEIDLDQRAVITAHLAACPSCAREVAALGTTQRQLGAWTVRDVPLGFRITSEAEAAVPSPVWWRQPLPAWMQMAAAVLLFAGGAVLGSARGTSQDLSLATSQAPSPAPAVAEPLVSPQQLSELEQRLRREMTELRASVPQRVDTRAQDQGSSDAVLTEVRTLIAESEDRQRRELALRTAQIIRDVENQRRVDLAQVQGTWRQMQGLTDAEVRQQREMLNFLTRRVSQ